MTGAERDFAVIEASVPTNLTLQQYREARGTVTLRLSRLRKLLHFLTMATQRGQGNDLQA